MKINEVILSPVLTEKAINLAKKKVYVFKAGRKANKFQIKEVLENIYKVKVGKIRIQIKKGGTKKVGRKRMVKRLPDEKIVYVFLKEGKIDLFPET